MKSLGPVGLLAILVLAVVACGKEQSSEDKVKEQLAAVHSLTVDERNMASASAKNYYEQAWLPAGGKQGQLISCRPSDSNFNGLVTCSGFVPQPNGTFAEIKRYCGYRADLVGCSDKDEVK